MMDGISGSIVSNSHYTRIVESHLNRKANLIFENIYGFDSTALSFAALVTGTNPSDFNVLGYRNSKYLKVKGNLIKDLSDKNYRTVFISNNYCNNYTMFLDSFDKNFLFREQYPLPEISELKSSQKQVIFIHDLFTHDQNGQYSKGKFEYTMKEYEELIDAHFSDILPTSLRNLGFDNQNDDLILFSDHGMTIGDITKYGSEGDWANPSLDLKSRIFCFCFFSNESERVIKDEPCTILSIHKLLKGKYINRTGLSDISYKKDNYIVNIGNSSIIKQDTCKLNQLAYFESSGGSYTKYIFQVNPHRAASTKIFNKVESECQTIEDFESQCPREAITLLKKVKKLNQKNLFVNLHAKYLNLGHMRHILFILPMKIISKFYKSIIN